jgi:sec-independent protein translocase protein TatB
MLSIPHLIIFVVALVVFGPEKLPELARNLGKVMAEFRRATGDLRSTFEDHLRDLEQEAEQRRIGGGTNYRPPTPVPRAEATQANVPAPVPTSAPNSQERLDSSTYGSPGTAAAPDGSNGSAPDAANSGSESATSESESSCASGSSPASGPASATPESPHTTRP